MLTFRPIDRAEDVDHYERMLLAIDAKRVPGPGGVFGGVLDPGGDPAKTIVPEGQALLEELLAACLEQVRPFR